MKQFITNSAKLKELMLYVAQKSQTDPRFGATKLNKILFYSDFMAYGLLGEPITHVTYQRLDKGPAPRALLPIQQELVANGEARIDHRPYFNNAQKRLIALREPDLSGFSSNEIALVDRVIEVLWGQTGSGVSELSHTTAGWLIAGDREDIPYETVFLSTDPITKSEINRIQQFAQKNG